MPHPSARGPAIAFALVLLVLGGCARDARGREAAGPAPAPGAPATRPMEGLGLGADAIAARIGSFAWEGDVTWTVQKVGAAPVHATERHRIRQLATGDFEATLEIDPGGGPGSVTGRTLVSKGGKVYARGRWAPFRERPGDRGEGARRFRDDSVRIAADLVQLLGPALAVRPDGTGTVAGRSARRYALALASAPATLGGDGAGDAASKDPDTARRRAFLEGRVPTAAAGELLVDAATGVPLAVSLRASFTQRDEDRLRADVALEARVAALGSHVAAVRAPPDALPDDRKPKGVARALEAAGLRKHGAAAAPETAPAEGEEEPADEP